MRSITNREKMFFLILLVLLLIITCLVSEKYREPENIYHLSNAVSETQISSIPYLQFQKSKFVRSKYYVMRYTYDGKVNSRNELANEILKRVKEAGYTVTVSNSTKERFYILAESEKIFFEISVFPDLLSISVNQK